MENEITTTTYDAYIVIHRIGWPGRDEQLAVCQTAKVSFIEDNRGHVGEKVTFCPSACEQAAAGRTVILTNPKAHVEQTRVITESQE